MKLGELLVEQQKVSSRDINRALIAQEAMGQLLGQVLVKLGLVSELDVAKALAQLLDIELLSIEDYPESAIEIDSLSLEFLMGNNLVPISVKTDAVVFASTVPQDAFLAKALGLVVVDKTIEICLGLETDIITALQKYIVEDDSELVSDFDSSLGDEEFVEHLKDLASGAPVISLVNQIIHRAVDIEASDIHIEPFDDSLQLRYRVDGVLQDAPKSVSTSLAAAVTSRIKLLANMNIAEQRLPQDGRITMRVKGHELDLRVSTTPTVHGESVVMRVLDRQSIRLSLTDMGFSPDTLERYQSLLNQPHGVLLVTGPTGSGKTTTLYASLAMLDAKTLKIITVEDPVEYQLKGINQIQVKSQIDLTFSNALRSILRQDPDVIMIGEMRDGETAQIGIQSALTGHLVLSTLHTNTAAGAIVRLEDMGIERYLITSAVSGVLAQRLIRLLCTDCRESVALSEQEIDSNGLKRFLPEGQTHIYRSKGCDACKHTGYKGRMAIHELFALDNTMQKEILAGADAMQLHQTACQRGMFTLYDDGLRKVVTGQTSLEEVLRVTQDQYDD